MEQPARGQSTQSRSVPPGGVVALIAAVAAAAGGIAGCTGSTSSRALLGECQAGGWDGDPRFWKVERGVITGQTTAQDPAAHNTFMIYRGCQLTDFELTLEYRVMSESANSGVQYRAFEVPATSDADRWIVGGYQADIDEPVRYTGILYGEMERGILAQQGQRVVIEPGGKVAVIGTFGSADSLALGVHPRGQWNSYRIKASGCHIEHWINGIQMVDVTDRDDAATGPMQKGSRASGLLALQIHTGAPMTVQFRNITLKELH